MSEIKLTGSQIDDLIQELQGSCQSMDVATEALFGVSAFDLDSETLEEIDQHLFCCDACGWWLDMGDLSSEVDCDENVCKDCEDEYLD